MSNTIIDPFEYLDPNKDKKYGPGNPEPGGDGTKGEDTKEIVNLIKNCRQVLQLRSTRGKTSNPYKEENSFEHGDLVYDMRHEEHGVVLGEMPDVDNIIAQISNITTPRMVDYSVQTYESKGAGNSKTYIVLTITTKDEKLKTRIRYSNGNYLRLVQESNTPTSDLEIFCSQQCIMECTADCVLRKYKRTR